MKKLLSILITLCFATIVSSQTLDGAYKLTHQNGKEVKEQTTIKIYQDGYFAFGTKETSSNKFLNAGGGEFSFKDKVYTETFDFNTANKNLVGTSTSYSIKFNKDKLTISTKKDGNTLEEIWQKVGDAKNDLTGNWVITGRKRAEEISRSVPGARRTIKILSGGYFQWVAFNSDTKEFSGTGGGTYTAVDGKYVENIQFFSRDDKRVGASLDFKFSIIDGEWHHSGMSSTGAPIYEIWTKYKDAYKPAK